MEFYWNDCMCLCLYICIMAHTVTYIPTWLCVLGYDKNFLNSFQNSFKASAVYIGHSGAVSPTETCKVNRSLSILGREGDKAKQK